MCVASFSRNCSESANAARKRYFAVNCSMKGSAHGGTSRTAGPEAIDIDAAIGDFDDLAIHSGDPHCFPPVLRAALDRLWSFLCS